MASLHPTLTESTFLERVTLNDCDAGPDQFLRARQAAARVLMACGFSPALLLAARSTKARDNADSAGEEVDELRAALRLAEIAAASTLPARHRGKSFALVLHEHGLH